MEASFVQLIKICNVTQESYDSSRSTGSMKQHLAIFTDTLRIWNQAYLKGSYCKKPWRENTD